jgi:glycosyltransferase involved in cell wall biosynthesis
MKILYLATDAFGGRGGIADFTRHFLRAMAQSPLHPEIVVLPCRAPDPVPPDSLHPNLIQLPASAGRLRYPLAVWQACRRHGPFDCIFCGHLFLLRNAALARRLQPAPLYGAIYGIDAWVPPKSSSLRRLVPRLDAFLSVSEHSKNRFLSWAPLKPETGRVLPCCVDLDRFTPGARPDYLDQRYQLSGRRVLLTMARLDATERYKGFDETLELLPELRREQPDLAYVVVGDGSDRERLEAKARDLGLQQDVVFTGYVPEEEKVDHYRLADAFVMPGRGEGFGIVYLEAMACGVPAVASIADASHEAVLDGRLGEVVNPDDPAAIAAGIRRALARPRGRPEGLEHFAYPAFAGRVSKWLEDLQACPAPQA